MCSDTFRRAHRDKIFYFDIVQLLQSFITTISGCVPWMHMDAAYRRGPSAFLKMVQAGSTWSDLAAVCFDWEALCINSKFETGPAAVLEWDQDSESRFKWEEPFWITVIIHGDERFDSSRGHWRKCLTTFYFYFRFSRSTCRLWCVKPLNKMYHLRIKSETSMSAASPGM
jgi:hypothetical protein